MVDVYLYLDPLCVVFIKLLFSVLESFVSLKGSLCLCGFQVPENIYSNILPHSEPEEGGHQQEATGASEEVSYASVQFRHKNQTRIQVQDQC